MSGFFMRGAGLAALWGLLSAAALAAPPLEAYGQLPAASNVVLSPDGKRYGLVTGIGAETRVEAHEVATGKLLAGARTSDAKVRGLVWGDNDHLIITVSDTVGGNSFNSRGELSQLSTLNVVTTKIVRIPSLNVIVDRPLRLFVDGRPAVVVQGINALGYSVVYRVNLDTGRIAPFLSGDGYTIDWVLDANGRAVARADFDGQSREWRLFTRPGDIWKRGHSEVAALERPSLIGLGPTEGTILVSLRENGDWQTREVQIADGNWGPLRPDLNTDSLLIDPATRRPIGTLDIELDKLDYSFFSEADQRMMRSLTKAFPGDLVTLITWSDDRRVVVVKVEGTANGNAYFLIDRGAKTAVKVADAYAGIDAAAYNPVQGIHFAAADGLDIPAYLTLPKGVPAQSLPLIMLPHGGPAERDTPGFDWWAQALASRGYAVLQPQFRGSDGFGGSFRDAGFGEWGRKMQTDLSDGVRHLAKAGTIDPKRVCIVGASYGGYAALAGVTLDPGVYRCASAVAGVSDLRQMLVSEVSSWGGEKRNPAQRWWRRYMGVENSDDPKLLAISPARHAAVVKVPVQLIHGKDDTVVDYKQSVTMQKALQTAGAPVEFITLEGEDHWLSRGATRKQMLTAMVAFLEKYNPPGAGAAR
jgi:dipeptidyl aminopeptidase/acylaminoacyl peptidase